MREREREKDEDFPLLLPSKDFFGSYRAKMSDGERKKIGPNLPFGTFLAKLLTVQNAIKMLKKRLQENY